MIDDYFTNVLISLMKYAIPDMIDHVDANGDEIYVSANFKEEIEEALDSPADPSQEPESTPSLGDDV